MSIVARGTPCHGPLFRWTSSAGARGARALASRRTAVRSARGRCRRSASAAPAARRRRARCRSPSGRGAAPTADQRRRGDSGGGRRARRPAAASPVAARGRGGGRRCRARSLRARRRRARSRRAPTPSRPWSRGACSACSRAPRTAGVRRTPLDRGIAGSRDGARAKAYDGNKLFKIPLTR